MKLSIITINLNNSSGLSKTLLSVFEQDFIDFEQIVIDGGSTDDSINIIEAYKKKIAYTISEKDRGIYNAMNKGINAAKGEYLIFMNSGDKFYNPHILSSVFNKKLTTDYIFGDMLLDCGRKLIHRPIPKNLSFYYLFTHTLYHQSMFVRKEVFTKYGYYDETLKITSDWRQYLIAIFKYNCSYTLISEIFSVNAYDGVSSQRNGNMTIILKERDQAFIEYFPGFYDDYKELHQFKKWTIKGIIRGIKRRYFEYLSK